MSITKLNNLSISAVTALPSGVGGKVLQVVSASDSTQRTTTSTSFVTASNTLSVSITPSSASNKVLIIGHTTVTNNTANKSTYLTVYRGATNLGDASSGFVNYYSVDGVDYNSNAFTFLDSPSSTSALTYQVYLKADPSSTGYVNANSAKGSITVLEIAG